MVRSRASHPSLGPGVVEHPARVMEHLAHLGAAAGQLGAGRLDVSHGELQALGRARRGGGDPGAEDDRALRARRCQLHHPEVRTGGEVGILPPPQRLIEVLGPVHVGDRHHHNLELHVHDLGSSPL